MTIQDSLPHADSRPRRISITPDDIIWYTDYARGYLGRFDPLIPASSGNTPRRAGLNRNPTASHSRRERCGTASPGARPNTLVRFDPAREAFQSWIIPSGGGVVRNMMTDREGNLVIAESGQRAASARAWHVARTTWRPPAISIGSAPPRRLCRNSPAGRKSKVFVAGLSMGGVLTLNLAGVLSQTRVGDRPHQHAGQPASGGHRRPRSDGRGAETNPWNWLGHQGAGRQGTRLRGDAGGLRAPALHPLRRHHRSAATELYVLCSVIHSREDHLVSMANAKKIAASVASDDVRLLWLDNSYHVSTLDNDKDLIVERAGYFSAHDARSVPRGGAAAQ